MIFGEKLNIVYNWFKHLFATNVLVIDLKWIFTIINFEETLFLKLVRGGLLLTSQKFEIL